MNAIRKKSTDSDAVLKAISARIVSVDMLIRNGEHDRALMVLARLMAVLPAPTPANLLAAFNEEGEGGHG